MSAGDSQAPDDDGTENAPRNDTRTEFSRLAADPHLLMRVLDPPDGTDPAEAEAELTEEQQTALKAIDALAGHPLLKVPPPKRHLVDDELAFTLALDRKDPSRRLRATICRAFMRARQIDQAQREIMDNADLIARSAKQIGKAINALDAIPLSSKGLQEVIGGVPDYCAEGIKDLARDLDLANEILSNVRRMTQEAWERAVPVGRPEEVGLKFFVLRLAEVGSALTGTAISLNAYERKPAAERRTLQLADIAAPALKIAGFQPKHLNSAAVSLRALRHANDGSDESRPGFGLAGEYAVENGRVRVEDASGWKSRPTPYGHWQSAALEINWFGDSLAEWRHPPKTWRECYGSW